MTDSYRIDDHKLLYHPERIAQWLQAGNDWEKAKKVYPLYIEISPTGMCNHRCRFCAMDYIGYKPRSLDLDVMRSALKDMGEKGVKSVMLAGEGEPLLYKKIVELSQAVVASGIDLAFTTNGVLLDSDRAEQLIPLSTWIKVSIAAGSPETYAYIHGTDKNDFDKVVENLSRAVEYRDKKGLTCTIGAQFLLLPENVHELEKITEVAKDRMGLDYLVIKPYSQHLFSNTREYSEIDYAGMLERLSRIEAMGTSRFKVIVRKNALRNTLDKSQSVDTCYTTPFLWAYMMASHDLYSCSAFLQDNRFLIGNLQEKSFTEAWEGEGRHRIFDMMTSGFDTGSCRINCRMNAANRYLWELKHPSGHRNFI